jgi:hypothetical protein
MTPKKLPNPLIEEYFLFILKKKKKLNKILTIHSKKKFNFRKDLTLFQKKSTMMP